MNTLPGSNRPTAAPSLRLPHQHPGAERGLSRGGDVTIDGMDPSFLGLDLTKLIPPAIDLGKKLFGGLF